jgi:transposase InsO family protein
VAGRPYNIPGLSELIRDLEAVDKDIPKALRERLREVGKVVARDVQRRIGQLHPPSPRTGQGVRVYVRKAGLVAVEQKEIKTTGRRPDWGPIQMRRAFLPAADANESWVGAQVEHEIDAVALRHRL